MSKGKYGDLLGWVRSLTLRVISPGFLVQSEACTVSGQALRLRLVAVPPRVPDRVAHRDRTAAGLGRLRVCGACARLDFPGGGRECRALPTPACPAAREEQCRLRGQELVGCLFLNAVRCGGLCCRPGAPWACPREKPSSLARGPEVAATFR